MKQRPSSIAAAEENDHPAGAGGASSPVGRVVPDKGWVSSDGTGASVGDVSSVCGWGTTVEDGAAGSAPAGAGLLVDVRSGGGAAVVDGCWPASSVVQTCEKMTKEFAVLCDGKNLRIFFRFYA